MSSYPDQREPASAGVGEARDLVLRMPCLNDAIGMKGIVETSGVLDVNSLYCYLLLCSHFAATCIVAESRGEIVGFTAAYLLPERPDVLFVWQIGVHESVRGKGVGASMLDTLLARDCCTGVRFLEATVTPGNAASKALFRSLARRSGTACVETPCFGEDAFGQQAHEAENLLRIGPLSQGRNHKTMEALEQ